MARQSQPGNYFIDRPFAIVLVVALVVALALFAVMGVLKSQADNEILLVNQGVAFTEALAQSAQTAIDAEVTFENLLQRRFSGMLQPLFDAGTVALQQRIADQESRAREIEGVFILDADSLHLLMAAGERGNEPLPDFVYSEAADLVKNPEPRYQLVLDQPEGTGEVWHYYVEISNDLQSLGVIVASADYYADALSHTQIGYLAQNIAKEKGVEYVLYQTPEGIVFSSRKLGQIAAIESDPFLSQALQSDSIMHRIFQFDDREVLEFARPFSSRGFPFGVLRVGLSLDRFYAVTRGFRLQMLLTAGALLVLLIVMLLYMNARRKRVEVARRFGQYKSISDTIFEQLVIGVAAVDDSGIIRVSNSAFNALFLLDNPIGKEWDTMISDRSFTLASIIERSRMEREFELPLERAGKSRMLLVGASPLRDDSNHDTGWVFVVSDVTRIKEMEQQTAHRERLSELGNLAAGVAHEIRNPLNAISIAAQRLSAEYPQESAGYGELTGQIRSETKRLNEIIARFLALTRSEQSGETSADMSREIEQCLNLFRLEAEQAGIRLTSSIEPDIRVRTSPDRVRALISNLFTNAREAMDGKGGEIEVLLAKSEHGVSLTFSDSGPGIPAEIRAKAFTPYFTTKQGGTGLGLAAVHGVVTSLGGDITIESSKWGGAKFVIAVPRDRA